MNALTIVHTQQVNDFRCYADECEMRAARLRKILASGQVKGEVPYRHGKIPVLIDGQETWANPAESIDLVLKHQVRLAGKKTTKKRPLERVFRDALVKITEKSTLARTALAELQGSN